MTLSATERAAWRAATALFDQLAGLSPPARQAFLDDATLDADVRHHLLAMLAAEGLTTPIDRPIEIIELSKEAELKGRTLGDWTLDDRLGRGGSALVFRAERTIGGATQDGAIKLLPMGLRGDAAIARFEREQSLLASLSHPQIATFLDAGVAADGTPYLVTEFVDGEPLDDYANTAILDTADRIRLIRDVARAVSHAHQRLVVHLDLKPANILVNTDGHVELLDFGIGHLLSQQTGEPFTRAFTPGYAAPEQMSGGTITTATDVYALGLLLGELLTGERNPSTTRNQLAGDLRNIHAKATAAEAEERYPNATALADDLGRWLDGLPVVATSPGAAYRLKLLMRRNPLATALSFALLTAVGLGFAGFYWQAQQATLQAEQAEQAAQRAAVESQKAREAADLLANLFASADPELRVGDALTARELVLRAADRLADEALEPAIADPLHLSLSKVLLSLGDYQAAERQLDAIQRQPASQEVLLLRAESLRYRGQLLQAKAAYEDAAAAVSSAQERLRAQLGLAGTVSAMAEFAAADRHFAEVFKSLDSLNDSSRWRRQALSERATHEANQGKFASATATIDEALELLGPNDQGLRGRLLTERAHNANESGDFTAAATDLDAADAAFEAIYRRDHPARLRTRLERASMLRAQGEAANARSVAVSILNDAQNTLGAHGLTAEASNMLGMLDYDDGDIASGRDHVEQSVEVMIEAVGEAHPNVASLRANLATLYRLTGNTEKSWEVIQQAYAAHARVLPPAHPDFIHTRGHYAHGLRQLGRIDEALSQYDMLVRLVDARFGPKHPQSVGAYTNLASLLRELDQSERALQHAIVAHDNAMALYPAQSPPVLATQLTRVSALIDLDQLTAATSLLAPIAAQSGAQSDDPNARTVLLQSYLRYKEGDIVSARTLFAQADQLLAASPDGGKRFSFDRERLRQRLAAG